MKTYSVRQTAVYIFILTLLSKVFGFAREAVLAASFGTSYITDAYVLSSSIPSMLFGGILGAIGTAFTPIYSGLVEKGKDGNRFTNQLITITEVVALVSAIVGIFFASPIVRVIGKNLSPEALKACIFYTRVSFSFVLFTNASGILGSYLAYHNIYIPQMLGGFLQNICIIALIFISAKTNSNYLIFGMFFGYLANMLVTVRVAKEAGYRFKPVFNLNENIREICIIAIPVFIGSEISTINGIIDRYLAAGLPEGSISSLYYGSLLSSLISAFTISIISSLMYPKITKDASLENWDHFKISNEKCITTSLLIVIPFTVGIIFYANDFVQVLYERGAFSSMSTDMTSSAFLMYSLAIPFQAISTILVKMSYSLKDSKAPLVCGCICIPINIFLNLILIKTMQHTGLALATSISSVVSCIILLIVFNVKHNNVALRLNYKKIGIIILESFVAVLLSKPLYGLIHKFIMRRTIVLILSASCAVLFYLVILWLTKSEELSDFIKEIPFLRRFISHKANTEE